MRLLSQDPVIRKETKRRDIRLDENRAKDNFHLDWMYAMYAQMWLRIHRKLAIKTFVAISDAHRTSFVAFPGH